MATRTPQVRYTAVHVRRPAGDAGRQAPTRDHRRGALRDPAARPTARGCCPDTGRGARVVPTHARRAGVLERRGLYFTHENYVEPDALYLAPEHLDRIGEKKLEGPPDLVVEISSPSTRRRDVTLKRNLYLGFGVRDYWFVDLDRTAVIVFRPDEDPFVLHHGDKLTSPVLPGFVLAVEDLFG
ncbi:MAG: Uma2 family endonuclease [Egibacteraceae bacterium]